MLSCQQLEQLRDNVDFQDYLMQPDHKHQNFYMRLSGQAMRINDFYALEIYVALKEVFETYPHFESIEPVWDAQVDQDSYFLLRARVRILPEEDGDTIFGYDHHPHSIAGNEKMFEHLMNKLEAVSVDNWNEYFKDYGFTQEFHSAQDVLNHMQEDVLEFSTEIERWYLSDQEKKLEKVNSETPSKRKNPRL